MHNDRDMIAGVGGPFGLVAEFAGPGPLLQAVKKIHAAGFTKIDTHTPFPVHGMDAAMGLGQSKLPWFVLVGALSGTASAFALQFWMNAVDYQFRIGGKPVFSYQSYVPIMFELTVLIGAFTTVLTMLAMNRLPQPYHPLFTHPRFGRCTNDAFILSVEATDPLWDEDKLRKLLSEAGGTEITVITDNSESAHV